MLGRLAKWLRILGFDAEYPLVAPREGRFFVTRRRTAPDWAIIRITSHDLMAQVTQVLEEAGADPDPDLFLARCLVCNVPVKPIDRTEVVGRVPPKVLETTDAFNQCPACHRVYWEGTHEVRIRRLLEAYGISWHRNGCG